MNSIIDVFQQYGIPFRQAGEDSKVTSRYCGFSCPLCDSPGSSFHGGWNLESNWSTCWRCGFLSPTDTLIALTGEYYPVVRKILDGLKRQTNLPEREELRGSLKIPKGVGDLLPSHKRYLQKRGFDPEEVSRIWGVKGIGVALRLQWRIWIPITKWSKTVSWTTRSISDKVSAKYITAKPEEEILSSKSVLFGADYARHAVVVVEGPLDAIKVGPGAVATLGVNVSHEQFETIASYPRRAICFDTEPEAQRRAKALVQRLSHRSGETHLFVLDSAKDAASASRKEIREIRSFLA